MTKTIYIILSYFLIGLAILQNLLPLAGIFILYFTYTFGAGYLLPFAFLIDGYFGAFYNIPYFSIGMLVWFVLSEMIRIRMRVM